MSLNPLHGHLLTHASSIPSPLVLSDVEEDEVEETFCCLNEATGPNEKKTGTSLSVIICRIILVAVIIFIVAIFYTIMSASPEIEMTELTPPARLTEFNESRAEVIIDALCMAVSRGHQAGNLCARLCDERNYTIADFYEGGSKRVVKLNEGGKDIILKMDHAFESDYADYVDPRVSDAEFSDKVVDIINEHLHLDWPYRYKHHLMKKLWPLYDKDKKLTNAERRSIWALLQQEEFINSKILSSSRVTPKVLSTCGHIYQTEYLIPFKMKPYYLNLKAKILVHLEGTLKLFEEFLNDPLNWCDVKFENLGLSADYPKRFVVLDSDMLYTRSKLDRMLTSRQCSVDSDCRFFDCDSVCNTTTGHCTERTNDNVDVFCKKLINQLFGSFWSKSNKYLAACHESSNSTKRLAGLRLVWAWSLSDV